MISYPDPNSRSAALAARARKVMPGGNTRLTVYYPPYPLYAARGDGAYVIDVDGNRLLDFIGNYTSAIHGHNFPPIVAALREQIEVLGAVGMPTESEIALAEAICARVASIEQIRFCNSGTEAVMMAVKAARAFTGRPKIAKLEGAYHGSYTGIEASTAPREADWGPAEHPRSTPYAFGTPASVLADTVVLPLNQTEAALSILDEVGGDLAGVLIDPFLSRIGYNGPTPAFTTAVQAKVKALGGVVIADEVYSFRMAYHGAQTLIGLEPDLTTLGKLIGGGIPIGAVGGRAEVMAVFALNDGTLRLPHGGTFNANPLAMRAGLAALEALPPAAYDRLDALGERLRAGLRTVARPGLPFQVSGRGSLTCMVLADAPFTDTRSHALTTRPHVKAMARWHQAMISQGVLITPSGNFVLSTVMTEADIDKAVAAAAAAAETLAAEPVT